MLAKFLCYLFYGGNENPICPFHDSSRVTHLLDVLKAKLHVFNPLSFTLASSLMAQLWSQASLFPYVFRSHFSHFLFKVTYHAVTRNGSCILIFWMISWLVTFSFSDYFWSLSFSAAIQPCQASEDRDLVALCLQCQETQFLHIKNELPIKTNNSLFFKHFQFMILVFLLYLLIL